MQPGTGRILVPWRENMIFDDAPDAVGTAAVNYNTFARLRRIDRLPERVDLQALDLGWSPSSAFMTPKPPIA